MKLRFWIICPVLVFIILLFQIINLSSQPVETGLEMLVKTDFEILKGKRVGLITNPTGVDRNLRSAVDILYNAPGVKLTALYGPEHGVRGEFTAGEIIGSAKDQVTGIPVYSLYGETRKPTREMLEGIDILVYDIQDYAAVGFAAHPRSGRCRPWRRCRRDRMPAG